MTTIAFIGVGNMGGPMARNLLKAQDQVRAFDLSAAALRPVTEAGGDRRADRAGCGEGCRCRHHHAARPAPMCGRSIWKAKSHPHRGAPGRAPDRLLDHRHRIRARRARRGGEGRLRPSSTHRSPAASPGRRPARSPSCAAVPTRRSNAPGRSSRKWASASSMSGGAGAGQAAKICNNMLLAISMIGTCEAFALGEKLGLDHQKLYDIMSAGPARAGRSRPIARCRARCRPRRPTATTPAASPPR